MVIMPISGITQGINTSKYMSFAGRKNNNEDYTPVNREQGGANNLAKVPVVVLMAMSPAMLNANHPKTNIETEAPAKTEMVTAPAKLDTEALDELTAAYPGVDGLQQSDDGRSVVMKNEQFSRYETIRNIESFEINGQKKYMVFAATKSSRPDVVQVVHIVSANNKNIKGYLPEVDELIYHDLGSPKKNFCSVKIYYDLGKNAKGYHTHLIRDERIPDEVANSLIDFLVGDTKFKDDTGIKVTKTNSAALQPDKK